MHVEVINGLLGAGKTTILLNLLENRPNNEKVAVLVNEFGEIGIDGDLLDGQGADVVELPNGCICCTLNADLKKQIGYIAETYHPDRLFIEPTGVATIKNIMGILGSLSLEKYIEDIKVTVVVDASNFMELVNQNWGFIENQLQKADVIMINKCDLAKAIDIKEMQNLINSINLFADIRLSHFGRKIQTFTGSVTFKPYKREHENHQGHEHELSLKKYEQFSSSSSGIFDPEKISDYFLQIQCGKFGSIDRAKGLFHIQGGSWLHIDLASGQINEKLTERKFRSSKIMAVGTCLAKSDLKEKFNKCLIK